ncbi:MAG: VWA domain-containing protein, partial [Myxococcaceae bacterium]
MNATRIRALAVLAAALAVAFACSNTYLFDERRDDALPNDRALRFEGEFCTPSTNEVRRPIKIAIAMDASQSMQVSDPFGARAQAVVDLINSLPNEPEVYISVLLFAGFTTTYLTRDTFGNQGFQQVSAMTPADRINLQ